MKGKNVLIGFLTGAAVAGVSTLLYAPVSGKELRKNVKNNKEEIQDIFVEIKSRINEMKIEAVSATKISKEAIKIFISDVKDLIESWKEDIEPHKLEIQYRIKEIESAITDLEQTLSPAEKKSESPI